MAESGGKRKTHKSTAPGSNLVAIQEDEALVSSDSDNPWHGLPYDEVMDPEMDRKTKLRLQWADLAVGIANRLGSNAIKEVHDRLSVPVASYDDAAKLGLEKIWTLGDKLFPEVAILNSVLYNPGVRDMKHEVINFCLRRIDELTKEEQKESGSVVPLARKDVKVKTALVICAVVRYTVAEEMSVGLPLILPGAAILLQQT